MHLKNLVLLAVILLNFTGSGAARAQNKEALGVHKLSYKFINGSSVSYTFVNYGDWHTTTVQFIGSREVLWTANLQVSLVTASPLTVGEDLDSRPGEDPRFYMRNFFGDNTIISKNPDIVPLIPIEISGQMHLISSDGDVLPMPAAISQNAVAHYNWELKRVTVHDEKYIILIPVRVGEIGTKTVQEVILLRKKDFAWKQIPIKPQFQLAIAEGIDATTDGRHLNLRWHGTAVTAEPIDPASFNPLSDTSVLQGFIKSADYKRTAKLIPEALPDTGSTAQAKQALALPPAPVTDAEIQTARATFGEIEHLLSATDLRRENVREQAAKIFASKRAVLSLSPELMTKLSDQAFAVLQSSPGTDTPARALAWQVCAFFSQIPRPNLVVQGDLLKILIADLYPSAKPKRVEELARILTAQNAQLMWNLFDSIQRQDSSFSSIEEMRYKLASVIDPSRLLTIVEQGFYFGGKKLHPSKFDSPDEFAFATDNVRLASLLASPSKEVEAMLNYYRKPWTHMDDKLWAQDQNLLMLETETALASLTGDAHWSISVLAKKDVPFEIVKRNYRLFPNNMTVARLAADHVLNNLKQPVESQVKLLDEIHAGLSPDVPLRQQIETRYKSLAAAHGYPLHETLFKNVCTDWLQLEKLLNP